VIPVKQRQHNDCVRAAVASILERDYEDVPNFMVQADETGQWWGRHIDKWLETEGYPFRLGNFAFNWVDAPVHEVFAQSFWLGQPWWFATVDSKITDGLHAVVMHGNEVAWDPGIHAEEPEYQAKPYNFKFANYFYVPEPQQLRGEKA